MVIVLMKILLAGLLLLLAGSGCGGKPKGPDFVLVTGTVVYKNAPLTDVNVTFLPEAGPAATGKTGADGKFSLSTNGQAGAVAGKHKVGVTSSEIPPMPGTVPAKSIPAPAFPAKFGDPARSGIEVTVAKDGPPVEIKLVD